MKVYLSLIFAMNLFASQSYANSNCTIGIDRPQPSQEIFEQSEFRQTHVESLSYKRIFTLDGTKDLENDPVIEHLAHYNTYTNSQYGSFYTVTLRNGPELVLSNLFPFSPPQTYPEKNLKIAQRIVSASFLDRFLVEVTRLDNGAVLGQFDYYAYSVCH